jgi:hypothetical protein
MFINGKNNKYPIRHIGRRKTRPDKKRHERQNPPGNHKKPNAIIRGKKMSKPTREQQKAMFANMAAGMGTQDNRSTHAIETEENEIAFIRPNGLTSKVIYKPEGEYKYYLEVKGKEYPFTPKNIEPNGIRFSKYSDFGKDREAKTDLIYPIPQEAKDFIHNKNTPTHTYFNEETYKQKEKLESKYGSLDLSDEAWKENTNEKPVSSRKTPEEIKKALENPKAITQVDAANMVSDKHYWNAKAIDEDPEVKALKKDTPISYKEGRILQRIAKGEEIDTLL